MRLKLITMLLLMFVPTALCFALSPPANIYSVEVGTANSQEEALTIKSQLETAGFSPISLVPDNGTVRVRFGEFDCYLDAYLYQQDLAKSRYPGSKVISVENTAKRSKLLYTEGPLAKTFALVEGEVNTLPTVERNDSDADIAAIEAMLKSSASNGDIIAAIAQKMSNRDNSDAVKGWLAMRLAYMNYRIGDKDACEQWFRKVATGEIKAKPEERTDAMMRVARMMHGRLDKVDAYRAWRETERLSPTPAQKVEALVEIAGLTVELARADYGPLSDATRACEKVLEFAPEEFARQRAVAELMHLETHYYLANYDLCEEEALAFLAKHTDFNKEIGMCRMFLACCLKNKGHYEEAVETMLPVLDLDLSSPDDKWKHFDIKKRALDFLIAWAEEEGDKSRSETWQDTRKQLFGE